MYKLESNQSDRINFSRDAQQYIEQQLHSLSDVEFGNTTPQDLLNQQIWNDDGGWIVDDVEEAKSRFLEAAEAAIKSVAQYRIDSMDN